MRKQILAKIFRTAFVCFVVFVVCSSATASVFQKIEVRDGTLYFEDGREVVFWGVNFQPSLSWEYGRMANHGLHMPFEMEAYQTMIDEAFDELQMMGCNLIRMKSEPRYEPFSTTSESADFFKNTALSYDLGCSAYSDGRQLIYSESMPQAFIDHLPALSDEFERIVGHGNSPYVNYGGPRLYFVESQGRI